MWRYGGAAKHRESISLPFLEKAEDPMDVNFSEARKAIAKRPPGSGISAGCKYARATPRNGLGIPKPDRRG